ncbi:hypothetical protein KI387_014276 [Taxus chinensis]|uniref:Transcription factor MYC/MYB N-terminal domain-containing protein n=1 Tax=Taxus chinensis TaxID=29808 RepID=A0AA38FH99_TAXCH|nr:hypothetical protein KI387_014276 [Taxus chinensis]
MTSVLQQILRLQCHQSGWCYAVFWKLKRLGRMMLTWEDGYCEFANPSVISTSALTMPELFLNGLNVVGNSIDCTTPGSRWVVPWKIRLAFAVAKMSYQVFSLGEGIIGRVAFTGKHQWILVENNCAGLANSTGAVEDRLMFEAGWQNQFAAGIKTIALIAVVPHGVVQLGSTHPIMENLELVKHIKTLFVKLQNVPGVFVSNFQEGSFTVKDKVPVLPAMPLLPNHIENLPILQGIPVASVQDYCNFIFQEKDSYNVLDKAKGPLALELRGLKTQPCLLASVCSSDASAKVLEYSSPSQINSLQLRSSSPAVNNQGGKTGGRTILPFTSMEMYPFQAPMQTMVTSSDNQQAQHATPSESKSCLPTMKQNLKKATCFPGQFYSSLISRQNSIEYQMHGSITSGIEQSSIQNSLLCKSKTNEISNLLGSSFTGPNWDEKTRKKRFFNEQDPYLRDFKRIMKPSLRSCHKGVCHAGDTSASSKPVLDATEIAPVDISTVPVDEADSGNVDVSTPPLSLVDTCTSGSYSKEASGDLAYVAEEQPNTKVLSSSVATFWNGLQFTEALGVEQCWLTEILEKDKPPIFQNDLAGNVGSTKVSIGDTAMSFAELSSLKNNEIGNKNLKFLRGGQGDDSQEILQLSACNKVSEAVGPCFPMVQDGDICGEGLLPKWSLTSPDVRNQSFEHLPGSICLSDMDVSGTLNFSADRELAGEFLSETDSGHLLNAVIGNMQPNVYQRQDDDVTNKTTCLRLANHTICVHCLMLGRRNQ